MKAAVIPIRGPRTEQIRQAQLRLQCSKSRLEGLEASIKNLDELETRIRKERIEAWDKKSRVRREVWRDEEDLAKLLEATTHGCYET